MDEPKPLHGEYPVTQYEWRITGDLLPETDSFHEAVRQEYPREREYVKKVVERGDALAKAAGSLDESLLKLQEPEFRKLNTQRDFINEKQHRIGELPEEMMGGMRIGVASSYTRPPPLPPRRGCLPYQDRESEEMMRGLRKDIAKDRMFLSHWDMRQILKLRQLLLRPIVIRIAHCRQRRGSSQTYVW